MSEPLVVWHELENDRAEACSVCGLGLSEPCSEQRRFYYRSDDRGGRFWPGAIRCRDNIPMMVHDS